MNASIQLFVFCGEGQLFLCSYCETSFQHCLFCGRLSIAFEILFNSNITVGPDWDEAGWETPVENLPPEEHRGPALSAPATKPLILHVDHVPDHREIPLTKNAGLNVGTPGSNPFDYFCLNANDDYFGLVIQETNLYANEMLKTIGTQGLG